MSMSVVFLVFNEKKADAFWAHPDYGLFETKIEEFVGEFDEDPDADWVAKKVLHEIDVEVGGNEYNIDSGKHSSDLFRRLLRLFLTECESVKLYEASPKLYKELLARYSDQKLKEMCGNEEEYHDLSGLMNDMRPAIERLSDPENRLFIDVNEEIFLDNPYFIDRVKKHRPIYDQMLKQYKEQQSQNERDSVEFETKQRIQAEIDASEHAKFRQDRLL